MARLPALSRRSSMDGVPHRISRWRPAPVARRDELTGSISLEQETLLGRNVDQATQSSAHQERETRMAPGTQTAYDIDVADVEYLRHGDKPLLARVFKPRG